MMVLTPKPESATYALSMLYDMKLAGQIALQSRFGGMEVQTDWGKMAPTWWALEMFNTMQRTRLEKEQNIVRLKVNFERVMVNATLKSIERMGRDLAQMQGSLEEKLDPRLVDARMKTAKPGHYWSEEHKWGPNWPISAKTNSSDAAATETEGASAVPLAAQTL